MKFKNNKASTVFTYVIWALAIATLVLKTVLALPFYQILFASIICVDNEEMITGE